MYFFNPDIFALGLATGVLGLVLLLSLVVSYAYGERTLLFLAAYLLVSATLLFTGQRLLLDLTLIQRFLLVIGPALVSGLQVWLFRKRSTGIFDKLVIAVVMVATLGLLGFYAANNAGRDAAGGVTDLAVLLCLVWGALMGAGFAYRSIQALETAGPWKWWMMIGHASGLVVALLFLTGVSVTSMPYWPVVLMLLLQLPPSYLSLVWRSRLLNEIRLRSAAANVSDPLTGLATATVLIERLMRITSRSQQVKEGAVGSALFLIQVQNLNGLLNQLGPDFNEKLLLESALRLRRSVGDNDLVARISGGRFAVVAQNLTSQAEVSNLATRLVVSGLRIDSPLLNGIELKFRVIVIGLKTSRPRTLPDAQAWLNQLAGHFDAWPSSHRSRSIWVVEDSPEKKEKDEKSEKAAVFVSGSVP